MSAAEIYETLCCAPDLHATLARMPDGALAAVVVHLEAGGIKSGVPFIVQAFAEAEIIRRWVEEHAHTAGAVGEGAL